MSKNINALIDVLNEELLLNEKLFEISKEKTEAIKGNDANSLMRTNDMSQQFMKKIIDCEKLRGGIVAHIEKELSVKNITNIKDIIANIDIEKSKKINEISTLLKKVLNELKINNDLNNKLLNLSLDYINININMITTEPMPNVYGNKAVENMGDKNKFFDAKY